MLRLQELSLEKRWQTYLIEHYRVKLRRHPGRDCRDPGHKDVLEPSPSMASGLMPGCPARHPSGECQSAPRGLVRQSMPERR